MKFSIGLWDKLNPRTQRFLMRIRRPLLFGTLWNTTPLSTVWGKDRGSPVDRYYIEQFLQAYRKDIHGKVVEVGACIYSNQFGTDVEQYAVLDNNSANPKITILADLESAINISSDEFDCLIFTQVLQFIHNIRGCIQELHRILKPGGVLLVTIPCVSRIDSSYGNKKDLWRFTDAGCEILFGEIFGKDQVGVHSYGNVLSSIAFLTGAAHEELSRQELDYHDPSFQLLICVRAVKR